MDAINDFFTAFSSFLWGWPMIILLLGTHIFLTIRLRFPQRKIFKAIALSVKKDKDATGDVSQFGALATALAATIGTGNMVWPPPLPWEVQVPCSGAGLRVYSEFQPNMPRACLP